MALEIVDRRQVEVQLPHESGVKRNSLKFNNYKTSQLEVVEEKVNVEVLISNFEMYLPAYEGKACPKFQKKTLNMVHQVLLNVSFHMNTCSLQEVKDIRIFERLDHQFRVCWWKS